MSGSDALTGLQWPLSTDTVASLAATMQAAIDGIAGVYAPPLTLQAGWSTLVRSGSEFRLLGNLFQWLDFTVTRTGAAIAFNATGGGVGDVDVAQLFDVVDRPAVTQIGAVWGNRGSVMSGIGCQVGAGGMIAIVAGPTSGTIATGDLVRFSGLYPKK